MNTEIELLDDEIIAQFMGLKRHEPDKSYWKAQYYRPDPKDARKKGDFVGYYDHLEYSTSWNELMPCVEKIEMMYSAIADERPTTELEDEAYSKILCLPMTAGKEIAYKSVVEFVKWYRSQPEGNTVNMK